MNKTIKVIDLLNEVSRGNNLIFKDGGGTYKDSLWTFINMYMDKRQSFKEIQELLNSEVILLEDNTEEIEELDRNLEFDDLITPYGKNEDMMWTEIIKQHNKIDEIIRYIKRKDKSND